MKTIISQDKLSIFLYHGVSDKISRGIENSSCKHMGILKFKEQMEYVKRNCNILSMDQVEEYCKSGESWPERSVAITFDDGFENNYTIAAVILEQLQIPATFYITSGIVGTDEMFWVDKLEDCINLSKKQEIRIVINGSNFSFSLENDEQRYNTLFIIKQYCKNCWLDEKDGIVGQVEKETDIRPSVEHSANYKKITWPQLKELHSNKLFTLGGHSLKHNILSKMSGDKAKEDIKKSIRMLEDNFGKIKHYSYPEGRPEHFNCKIVDILKEEGIVCCPTAIGGFNSPGANPFLLRRLHTNNADISR